LRVDFGKSSGASRRENAKPYLLWFFTERRSASRRKRLGTFAVHWYCGINTDYRSLSSTFRKPLK
jgi:hypothetical protein